MTKNGTRKPSRDDVSRLPRGADYAGRKRFYQSREVARDYDFHRWGSAERARRNAREWRTILRALKQADGIRCILDLPCGTGRFIGHLTDCGYDALGADIAMEMMQMAVARLGTRAHLHGFVRADAEKLPLASMATDCVMSIRFLLHVDAPARIVILREMARVSRRWLLLEYRHKYSYRYLISRLRRAIGVRAPQRLPQLSMRELKTELRAAGLRPVKIMPVAKFFSDKWIVLCEKAAAT